MANVRQSWSVGVGILVFVSALFLVLPTVSYADPSEAVIQVKNPLDFDNVQDVLGSLLSWLQGVIVILSILFIAIGAFFYITSAGNDNRMSLAKGAITASMVGLALGLAAPSFLKQIGDILGWGPVAAGPAAGAKSLVDIVKSVLEFLLSITGIIAIIMMIIGGLMYLTAAGDEDRAETGKKIVTYSIIGIAVASAALVIVTQISGFFS